MIRYEVTDYKGKELRYSGFNELEATTIVRNYRKAGIDLYLNEVDIGERDYEDSFEECGDSVSYYEDEELTALYGDDETIKETIIERIENDYGRKVLNPDECKLHYNDPGDSGDDANFHLTGIQLEAI